MSHPTHLANAVLNKHWNGDVPVNLLALCKGNNVDLYKQALPDGVRGKLDVTSHGASISYNPDDSLRVRRYVVAHLLGRYLLGHGGIDAVTPYNFNTGSTNPVDKYANEFAMALLIPSVALRSFVGTKYMKNVDTAANFFCVSPLAMGYAMDKELLTMYSVATSEQQSSNSSKGNFLEDIALAGGLALSVFLGS